jgi:hypothetical protein
VIRSHILTVVTIALCAAFLAPIMPNAALAGRVEFNFLPVYSGLATAWAGALGIFVAPFFGRPSWRGWATSLAVGLGMEIAVAGLVGASIYLLWSFRMLGAALTVEDGEVQMIVLAASSFVWLPVGGAVFAITLLLYSASEPLMIAYSMGFIALVHLVATLERRLGASN